MGESRTKKAFKRKRGSSIQRVDGEDDTIYFKTTKGINVLWFERSLKLELSSNSRLSIVFLHAFHKISLTFLKNMESKC